MPNTKIWDEPSDAEILAAHASGVEMADEGAGEFDAPYKHRMLREAWLQGWLQDRVQREEKKHLLAEDEEAMCG